MQAARFNDSETEVFRSLALQIIYVLEQRITKLDAKFDRRCDELRPKPRAIRRLLNDFNRRSPVTKLLIIGPLIAAIIAAGYAIFHDYIFPPPGEAKHVAAPKTEQTPVAPPSSLKGGKNELAH